MLCAPRTMTGRPSLPSMEREPKPTSQGPSLSPGAGRGGSPCQEAPAGGPGWGGHGEIAGATQPPSPAPCSSDCPRPPPWGLGCGALTMLLLSPCADPRLKTGLLRGPSQQPLPELPCLLLDSGAPWQSWAFPGSETEHSKLPPTARGFLPTSLLLSGVWSCWPRAPCSGLVSPQLITSAAAQFPNKITFKGATCLFWGHKSTPSPVAGLVGPPQSSRLLLPPALCTSGLRHPTPSWWVYSPVSCQSSPEPRDHHPTFLRFSPAQEVVCREPSWGWKQAGGQKGARSAPGTPPSYPLPTHFSKPFSFWEGGIFCVCNL